MIQATGRQLRALKPIRLCNHATATYSHHTNVENYTLFNITPPCNHTKIINIRYGESLFFFQSSLLSRMFSSTNSHNAIHNTKSDSDVRKPRKNPKTLNPKISENRKNGTTGNCKEDPTIPTKSYQDPQKPKTKYLVYDPASPKTLYPNSVNPTGYRAQGLDDEEDEKICPGCGIFMQCDDPQAPGFFVKTAKTVKKAKVRFDSGWEEVEVDPDEIVSPKQEKDAKANMPTGNQKKKPKEKKAEERSSDAPEDESLVIRKPMVCARCHSLRSYGKIKVDEAENLLPAFDFNAAIGRRLMTTSGPRTTVLMVVDLGDFDGSFPRSAAQFISKAIEMGQDAWKKGKPGNVPRLVIAATKLDLLPTTVTPDRLEKWVRQRVRIGGVEKLHAVHFVSAHKDWGIINLVEDLKTLSGTRGVVWVIGAQNAGKSSLINAMGKHSAEKVTHLTEAAVPGTTLGIMKIGGILSQESKLFDTPGLLNPYQLFTRLNSEEQKLVLIRKLLQPRTYRLVVGQSVHIAGLARFDVLDANVNSIYLTVWASAQLPLHMGSIERAYSMRGEHFGGRLRPPIGKHRVSELGEWRPREFVVCGDNWHFSSTDLVVAGLGWVSIGLNGSATLSVWTYDGIDVTARSALILHRSNSWGVVGFKVCRVLSKADSEIQKEAAAKNKKKKKGVKRQRA